MMPVVRFGICRQRANSVLVTWSNGTKSSGSQFKLVQLRISRFNTHFQRNILINSVWEEDLQRGILCSMGFSTSTNTTPLTWELLFLSSNILQSELQNRAWTESRFKTHTDHHARKNQSLRECYKHHSWEQPDDSILIHPEHYLQAETLALPTQEAEVILRDKSSQFFLAINRSSFQRCSTKG